MLVGLTGGIGSGKSTACEYFAEFGADIINTDQIARQLVAPASANLEQIKAHFGTAICHPDGKLDRRQLRQRITHNPAQRQWLEALLHPQIRSIMLQQAKQSAAPYCIAEIPLLVGTPFEQHVDRILGLVATPALQVARVQKRDALSKTDITTMIAMQASEAELRAIADDILTNLDDLAALRQEVAALHRQYLQLAGH